MVNLWVCLKKIRVHYHWFHCTFHYSICSNLKANSGEKKNVCSVCTVVSFHKICLVQQEQKNWSGTKIFVVNRRIWYQTVFLRNKKKLFNIFQFFKNIFVPQPICISTMVVRKVIYGKITVNYLRWRMFYKKNYDGNMYAKIIWFLFYLSLEKYSDFYFA